MNDSVRVRVTLDPDNQKRAQNWTQLDNGRRIDVNATVLDDGTIQIHASSYWNGNVPQLKVPALVRNVERAVSGLEEKLETLQHMRAEITAMMHVLRDEDDRYLVGAQPEEYNEES